MPFLRLQKVVNCLAMSASPYRADPGQEPLDLTDVAPPERIDVHEEWSVPDYSPDAAAQEEPGAGGRMVLGSALGLLAAAWIAFAGWSAGRALAGGAVSAPVLAQWIAVLAGPLGLLGLLWLLFGRTRRRESERFTRSVVTMRGEARSLEALLAVLRQRIDEEHAAMTGMADRLMGLGDEATHRLGNVRRDLEGGAEALALHGAALDRAAESARGDIGVLLQDLPRAEAVARAMSEELRGSGREATSQAAALEAQYAAVTARARDADEVVGGSAQRLAAHLAQIDSAAVAAAARLGETSDGASNQVEALLERAAEALVSIRAGIDAEAQSVTALVAQSAAGIGRAGVDAAEALRSRLTVAGGALDSLSGRIADQDRASQALLAGLERGLGQLDQRFVDLAAEGDHRAATMTGTIARVRADLEQLALQSAMSDGSLGSLAERTANLHGTVAELQQVIGGGLTEALSGAEGGAERLVAAVSAARPEVDAMHLVALAASERLSAGVAGIGAQQEQLQALLAAVESGVSGAEGHLGRLNSAITAANADAARLQAETGPALVAALVQVREAAGHAADRAREAIHAVIPEGAERLSRETRAALEAAVRDGVTAQLREVETVATRAVEAARGASERLTAQMLSIGQSASALEAHLEKTQVDNRASDSEAFARRSSMLIDAMHSAAIDVGKILSDEVDDRAWASYLKGDRGVFTRRAVRLLGNSEARGLNAHYDSDVEFQNSVNRYVHDFEAMLRRVLAERDGGMMGVTLMSSDMGKLYAALAQVIDRRRG